MPTYDFLLWENDEGRMTQKNSKFLIISMIAVVQITDSDTTYWNNDTRLWNVGTETWDETL